jgi:hypothetical protein
MGTIVARTCFDLVHSPEHFRLAVAAAENQVRVRVQLTLRHDLR